VTRGASGRSGLLTRHALPPISVISHYAGSVCRFSRLHTYSPPPSSRTTPSTLPARPMGHTLEAATTHCSTSSSIPANMLLWPSRGCATIAKAKACSSGSPRQLVTQAVSPTIWRNHSKVSALKRQYSHTFLLKAIVGTCENVRVCASCGISLHCHTLLKCHNVCKFEWQLCLLRR